MEQQQQQDEYFQAAMREENEILQRAMQVAQAEHLMRRCVEMNAESRRAAAAAGGEAGGGESEDGRSAPESGRMSP